MGHLTGSGTGLPFSAPSSRKAADNPAAMTGRGFIGVLAKPGEMDPFCACIELSPTFQLQYMKTQSPDALKIFVICYSGATDIAPEPISPAH